MVGRRTPRDDRGCAMTHDEKRLRSLTESTIGLALAAVFIYAGVEKIGDPLGFADTIAAFAVLPAASINVLALSLPFFEIACGVLLVVPRTRRIGALGVALSAAIFFLALLSALIRGLTLDCGCFGSGPPSRLRMWAELGLDLVLFGGGSLTYSRSQVRLPP
jgi:uncharacterized membrane protein YphA (DoxX/SURF4 family)